MDLLRLLSLVLLLGRGAGHELFKAAKILLENILDALELILAGRLHCHHLNVGNVTLCSLLRVRPQIERRKPLEVRIRLRHRHLGKLVILSEVLLHLVPLLYNSCYQVLLCFAAALRAEEHCNHQPIDFHFVKK